MGLILTELPFVRKLWMASFKVACTSDIDVSVGFVSGGSEFQTGFSSEIQFFITPDRDLSAYISPQTSIV